MSEQPELDPAELVRTLAATLRFARWTGADAVDRAWARPIETAEAPQSTPASAASIPAYAASKPAYVPSTPASAPSQPAYVPSTPASVPSAARQAPIAHDPLVLLERWRTRVTGCERCHHAKSRTQIVFGQGNPRAKLMIVGDTPGPLEDAAGQPFQGEAGALLDKMLVAIGLSRADVWLTTLTLCRPPQEDVVGAEAIVACSPYLRTQIEAIRPQAVLLMGEVAAQFLFKQQQPLGELRGHWQRVLDRPTLATWPPAALLVNPAKKREAWADLQQVQKALQGA